MTQEAAEERVVEKSRLTKKVRIEIKIWGDKQARKGAKGAKKQRRTMVSKSKIEIKHGLGGVLQ